MTFKYPLLVQVLSAFISLLASVIIIIMIGRATMSTPYRRLIFGLSAADVIHSLGLITGPFAPPNLEIFSWAVGNTQSCTVNGFSNLFGSIVAVLYLLSLSIYFFFKLNRKMTDAVFCQTIEKKMHFLIITFALSISVVAFATTSFNPLPNGFACHVARFPPGCAIYPEIVGECTRGATKYTLALIYLVNSVITPLCFIGVSVCMVLLIRRAIQTEQMYSLNTSNLSQNRSIAKNVFSCILCSCYFERDQRDDEADTDYVLRLYRRETIIQASLHIASFLLTNVILVFLLIVHLSGIYTKPPIITYLSSFLYPSMGLFNILIYCRPKVQWFRLAYPEVSWFRAFLLVVKAGGEVPNLSTDPRALELCSCCGPRQREQPQQEQSYQDPSIRFAERENFSNFLTRDASDAVEGLYLPEFLSEITMSRVFTLRSQSQGIATFPSTDQL